MVQLHEITIFLHVPVELMAFQVPKPRWPHVSGLDSPRGGHVFHGTPGDRRRPLRYAQQHLLGREIDLTKKGAGSRQWFQTHVYMMIYIISLLYIYICMCVYIYIYNDIYIYIHYFLYKYMHCANMVALLQMFFAWLMFVDTISI